MARSAMSYSRSFLGAGNRQTLSYNNTTSYKAMAPIGSHFRDATCAEVKCDKYVNGWWVALNPQDETHRRMVEDVKQVKLKYKTVQYIDPNTGKANGFIRYEFYSGQECLQSLIAKAGYNRGWHKISLERPIITVKQNNQGKLVRKEHNQWVDEMDDHLHKLKKEIG